MKSRGTAPRPVAVETLEGRTLLAGTGVTGSYYDGRDFTSLKFTRTDAAINFNWGQGSPSSTSIAPDTFSVRWEGQVQAPTSERFTFHTATDDGVRLWVNNTLIIDQFHDKGWTSEYSGSIQLTAGQRYNIRVDYYENVGGAYAQLRWSSPSRAKQIVPTEFLYPKTTSGPTTAPPPPSGLSASGANGKIQLNWTDTSKSELGFRVERRRAGTSDAFAQIATAPTNATGFADTTAASGVTYTYRVRSFNEKGASAPSNEASARVGSSAATISWSTGPIAPIARVEAHSVQVGSRMYVWGGFVNSDYGVTRRFDVLDLATNTWSTRNTFPGPETHSAVATDGQRYVYVAGGQYGGGIPGAPTRDVFRYDSATDSWTRLPSLPEARYLPAMSHLNGKLYLFGGDRPDRTTVANDLWVLDLNNSAAGWVSRAPLPLAGDHISAAQINGIIYAIGGEHDHATSEDDDAKYIQHPYLFAYNPATNAWTRKADLPIASSHAEAGTLVINNKIVVLGGQVDNLLVTANVRVYNPATNVWTSITSLPAKRKGGEAAYYNGRIYYSNGQPDGDYQIKRDTWIGLVSGL